MTRHDAIRIRPLTIGPKNAEQMTGHSWRWLRDHAAELGVEVIAIDGKRVILAAPLLTAFERRSAGGGQEHDARDEVEAMRLRIARAG